MSSAMDSLDPSKMEWGEGQFGPYRLFYDGEPSSIIKEAGTNEITRDPFPSNVYLLESDEALDEVIALDSLDIIPLSQIAPQAVEPDLTFSQIENTVGSSPAPVVVGGTANKWSINPNADFREQEPSPQKGISRRGILLGGMGLLVLGGGGYAASKGAFRGDANAAESPGVTTEAAMEVTPVTASDAASMGKLVDTKAVDRKYAPTGFNPKDVKWSFQFNSANIAASAFQEGVFLSNGNEIVILDPMTGETKVSIDVDGIADFVNPTALANGEDAPRGLAWKIGNSLYLWTDDNRISRTPIDPQANMSSMGRSVMVKQGGVSYSFTHDGLKKIMGSDGNEIALDHEWVISSGWNGPIIRKKIDGSSSTSNLIQPPKVGMTIETWHGAGHGKAAIGWRGEDDKVILGITDAATGAVLDSVESTLEAIDQKRMKIGQGWKAFSVGPYLFDLDSGRIILDASKDANEFMSINQFTSYASRKNERGVITYVKKKRDDRITPSIPLAILDNGMAVARTAGDRVSLLGKES